LSFYSSVLLYPSKRFLPPELIPQIKLERTQIKKIAWMPRHAHDIHPMTSVVGVMPVECVCGGCRRKEFIEKFNLRMVAKDILDNHCAEWKMDGGNSWSMGQ
jgi:hypothetical protein